MGMQDFAYPAAIDYSFLIDSQLEIALNVLINSVAASSSLNDWDEVFVDIFNVSAGAGGTIDPGNTTAVFESAAYSNEEYVAGSEETSGYAITGQNPSADFTATFACLANGFISEVNARASSATEVDISIIQNSVVLATKRASIGGAADVQVSFTLADYSDIIKTDVASGVFTIRWLKISGGDCLKQDNTVSDTETSFSYANQLLSGASGASPKNLKYTPVSAGGTPANKLVQTNAITIITGPTGHQVYCHNTLGGSGTITYDISFDNGSTWVSDQVLNQKNTGVHAGTQMILKLNLNGVGGGNTATAEDYGVLLFRT